MGQPRTNYPVSQTVAGIINELISAAVTLDDRKRDGQDDPELVEHARYHVMAALELAKRMFRATLEHTKVPGLPNLRPTKSDLKLKAMLEVLTEVMDDNTIPPGMTITIADDGEVLVGGENVHSGYYEKP